MKKFWQTNKKIIGGILLLVAVWQAGLVLLSLISPRLLPARERFMYNEEEKLVNPIFWWNRANFDGAHYLSIAKSGYGTYQQAFFPLYPKLIRTLTGFFSGRDLVAGLIISNVSLILFLFVFYQLILLDFDHKVARRTLIFLMLFPTAFYFGLVYTESLFFFFLLGCFYAARKSHWLAAGILGALAANTRLVGIFLFPALIYEFYEQSKIKNLKLNLPAGKAGIKNFIPLLLVPLGLLFYMRFLKVNFTDPLLFIHSQPFFGINRTGGEMVLLYQVFYRYLKMILTTKSDPLYFTVWLELFSAIGFIYLLIKCYFKKIRRSYLVFSILALVVPTFTGTFSSLPRYVLILFPCFIFLGMIKSTKVRRVVQSVFLLLAIFSAILFFNGYWIA